MNCLTVAVGLAEGVHVVGCNEGVRVVGCDEGIRVVGCNEGVRVGGCVDVGLDVYGSEVRQILGLCEKDKQRIDRTHCNDLRRAST
jgi:hypothetical protein